MTTFRPSDDEIKELHDLYKFIMNMKHLNETKRNELIKSLWKWAPWCYRVVGISKGALDEICRRYREEKKWDRKGFCRDHVIPQKKTIENLTKEVITDWKKWWQIVEEGDQTRIVTRTEHDQISAAEKVNNEISMQWIRLSPPDGLFQNAGAISFKLRRNTEAKYLVENSESLEEGSK